MVLVVRGMIIPCYRVLLRYCGIGLNLSIVYRSHGVFLTWEHLLSLAESITPEVDPPDLLIWRRGIAKMPVKWGYGMFAVLWSTLAAGASALLHRHGTQLYAFSSLQC